VALNLKRAGGREALLKLAATLMVFCGTNFRPGVIDADLGLGEDELRRWLEPGYGVHSGVR